MSLIQPVRGMRDLLPSETAAWRALEAAAARCFAAYGYREARTPVLEKTELFARQLGEHTDVVQKEMYAFTDGGGENLTLRPEATVAVVRAALAAGLHRAPPPARLFYSGAMFRRERPQKGRYRQFHQFGAEALGAPAPEIDAEIILMCRRLFAMCGVEDRLTLVINNLGSAEERAAHRGKLRDYFRAHINDLDEASRARVDDNPLRILDSKNAQTQAIAAAAPRLAPGKESAAHFDSVKRLLDAAKLRYEEDAALVRGLDYYNLTVFEWRAPDDRRQNAVCGGGRYDGLAESIGGPPLAGCGFAAGVERLLAEMEAANSPTPKPTPSLQVAAIDEGDALGAFALNIAERLRAASLARGGDDVEITRPPADGGGAGRRIKKASGAGATHIALVGEDELRAREVTIKRLADGAQEKFAVEDVDEILAFVGAPLRD